jgi:predicted nucleic acid-binding protein
VIAADTSSLIAYLRGDKGADVERLVSAIDAAELCLPPVVVTELLSDQRNAKALEPILSSVALLEIVSGYWQRAGQTRATLLARSLGAKVPDTLIAQSCIDHDVALITRDTDFRHFAKHCGLRLA